ncbi:MAG TPA: cupin domain-containing protein [Paraburkholderia sp.]|nr:cupin domain-containing protein [Paraburkholderia sp.]
MSAIHSSSITTIRITKICATADIERKTASWATWLCEIGRFEHRYVPGASFYVVRGQASLTFSDGTKLDIEGGDFVSIDEGAEAVWDIRAPIETRYCYHANGVADGDVVQGAEQ